MAMPIIPVPPFPNVPALPGVPPLLRGPATVLTAIGLNLLSSDAPGVLTGGIAPVWGVFDAAGLPVALADTVTTLSYRGESHISTYPQEQGAFSAVNKVQMPYEARVQLVCGRTESDRSEFLAAIEAAKQSTTLYRIVTPETTYENANITGYDYRREVRNGVGMLRVDLMIQEVRVSGGAQFADVQNPASADTVSQGQVQASQPTVDEAALMKLDQSTGIENPSLSSQISAVQNAGGTPDAPSDAAAFTQFDQSTGTLDPALSAKISAVQSAVQ